MPKVSVVVPTYNSAKYLNEAIDSALTQTFKPIEVIVVDDGSTDDTKNIIKRYGSDIVYCYQQNAGSGKARNTGIKLASGEWIAFLDSDDFWDHEYLYQMTQTIKKHPNASLIYCGKNWVNSVGKKYVSGYEQTEYPHGWIFNALFNSNYISSSSVVVAQKNSLLRCGGFCEAKELRNAQDYHLWLRMSALYEIYSLPKLMINYRRHDSNRTYDVVSRQRGILFALNQAADLIKTKKVDHRNKPELINYRCRLGRAYTDAINSLFYSQNFRDVIDFSVEALLKGYINRSIIQRLLISFFPAKFILQLRSYNKRLFNKNANK